MNKNLLDKRYRFGLYIESMKKVNFGFNFENYVLDIGCPHEANNIIDQLVSNALSDSWGNVFSQEKVVYVDDPATQAHTFYHDGVNAGNYTCFISNTLTNFQITHLQDEDGAPLAGILPTVS